MQTVEQMMKTRVKNTGNNWEQYKFEMETKIYDSPQAIYDHFYLGLSRTDMLVALKIELEASDEVTLKTAAKAEKRIFVYLRGTQTEATQSVCSGVATGDDAKSLFTALNDPYQANSKIGIAQKLRQKTNWLTVRFPLFP